MSFLGIYAIVHGQDNKIAQDIGWSVLTFKKLQI